MATRWSEFGRAEVPGELSVWKEDRRGSASPRPHRDFADGAVGRRAFFVATEEQNWWFSVSTVMKRFPAASTDGILERHAHEFLRRDAEG